MSLPMPYNSEEFALAVWHPKKKQLKINSHYSYAYDWLARKCREKLNRNKREFLIN